ncbi:uncharacterized protein LOC128679828 [Plodia interpunctella]|uniref:uncharacterized protein LOC128679828 n=1 Tax=Plodia interpunctella TaxID=58824 RepID=UPI002368CF05|nr:uncharacterized protein LOC128679828 [Plodia interpunctella]
MELVKVTIRFYPAIPISTPLFTVFAVIIWVSKNLVLQCMMCTECEQFYCTIKDVEVLCANVLRTRDPGPITRSFKTIQRYNLTCSKMNAYGLFDIDAKMPAKLLAAVATYTVVILQLSLKNLWDIEININSTDNSTFSNVTASTSIAISSIFLATIWATKNIVLLSMLSATCERFHSSFKHVQVLCTDILRNGHPGRISRIFKTIKRYNLCYAKLNACGLINIDAKLPAKLVGAVATYSIVILQFSIKNVWNFDEKFFFNTHKRLSANYSES